MAASTRTRTKPGTEIASLLANRAAGAVDGVLEETRKETIQATPTNPAQQGPAQDLTPSGRIAPGDRCTRALAAVLERHRRPATGRSLFQIATSVIPYAALWLAMAWSLEVSYWLTLAFAVPAAGFLVRIFIIFHDCGHGSFFRSRRANRIVEFITGVLTFAPYRQWRKQHALHHATSGDLDRRGSGDIWTMTVQEYLESPRSRRLAYRIARHPLVLLLVAPFYVFLIRQRLPAGDVGPREHRGVHGTNVALAGLAVAISLVIGIKAYFLIQMPVILLAGAAGIWLFYVQHQFEGVYWARGPAWDYSRAALEGSSYYKLPRVLQWFSGNIGFHHIHHLNPGIPNYRLEACHKETAALTRVPAMGIRASLKSLRLRLWDEESGRLVGFGQLRALRAGGAAPPGRRLHARPW